jgi:hypothetical protein
VFEFKIVFEFIWLFAFQNLKKPFSFLSFPFLSVQAYFRFEPKPPEVRSRPLYSLLAVARYRSDQPAAA